MRNAGKDIDVASAMVRDRDGRSYRVENLMVGDRVLYYGRPIPDFYLFDYHELWAFADLDLVVNRLRHLPAAEDRMDWYIEPDLVEVDHGVWRIRDGYLDVCVYEGVRYRIEDAHELAEGLRLAEISPEDAARALVSMGRLLATLDENGISGNRLLATLAPEMPR